MGLEVHAVHMLLWTMPEVESQAFAEAKRAEALAKQLAIPFTLLDLREYFYAEVVTPFLAEYAAGRTPNPCVICNQCLKFKLPELAALEGAGEHDYFATGHYARVCLGDDGFYHLHEAKDPMKDQSYMLYHLDQLMLSRLLLPLGESSKEEIRAEAAAYGLAAAKKKDSQDICFIADKDHHNFLASQNCASKPGHFVDRDGKVLGEHRGIGHYTVGQSKKLGIALGERQVVSKINALDNSIVLMPRSEFKQTEAHLKKLSFILPEPPESGIKLSLAVRYRARKCPVIVDSEHPHLLAGGECRVYNNDGLPAFSPGQAGVFYAGTEVVGGGIFKA